MTVCSSGFASSSAVFLFLSILSHLTSAGTDWAGSLSIAAIVVLHSIAILPTRQSGDLLLVHTFPDTALSLVEIMALLRQLSNTIKTQLKASHCVFVV